MDKIKEGILYLALHNQLKNRYGYDIISKKELFARLGRGYQIPRSCKYLVIKELLQKEMLEKIGSGQKASYKIKDINIDIEKDIKKLYRLAGIY